MLAEFCLAFQQLIYIQGNADKCSLWLYLKTVNKNMFLYL